MDSLTSSLAGLGLTPDKGSSEEPREAAKQEGIAQESEGGPDELQEEDRGPNLRIQLVSDLHIEFQRGRTPKIPVHAPVIGLLGDIGLAGTKIYAAFIRELSQKFTTVLLLAGNHEFYGGEYEERKYEIRSLVASLPNVHFMDRTCLTLGGVKVLGCTLWSHVPPSAAREVRALINDYAAIRMQGAGDDEPEPLTVRDTNGLHTGDATFLYREIANAEEAGETVLVLTHHAPLTKGTSAPEFESESRPANHAFGTDLRALMGSPVAAWVYGHTHFNPRGLEFEGTRVMANQKGYSGERTGAPFDPGFVLHVKGHMKAEVEKKETKRG